LVLVLLAGVLGIHRFYLGHIGIGVLMILTAGCCGILALIDLIRIITGDLKPKGGEYTETL
jgi:TM2 domain-containing membrane protein YozV